MSKYKDCFVSGDTFRWDLDLCASVDRDSNLAEGERHILSHKGHIVRARNIRQAVADGQYIDGILYDTDDNPRGPCP